MPDTQDELRQFLQGQRDYVVSSGAQTLEQIRAEWIGAIGDLCTTVEGYLADLVSEGLVTVARVERTVYESRLGEYSAPTLRITTPLGLVVTLVPVVRLTDASAGWAELRCADNYHTMIRDTGAVWHLVHNSQPIRLGRETFIESFFDLVRTAPANSLVRR